MKLLWNAGSDARLVLIGPSMGDFERDFASQPEHVRERILMLGMTDEATKKDAFAACDVFVMASSADSFGTVYWRRGSTASPSSARRQGASQTWWRQGRDGLLVRFGCHVELADAVSKLLADAGLRRRMGEEGRRKVLDEYTWDAVFGRFARVIGPLLARDGDCSSDQHRESDERE